MGKKFKKKKSAGQINQQEAAMLLRVRNLFIEKEWKIDETNKNSMYTRTIESLKLLQNDEVDLILKLLSDFSYYSLKDYKNFVLRSMLTINEKLKVGEQKYTEEKIYVAPVVQIYAENTNTIYSSNGLDLREFKINSSSFLAYIAKSKYLKYHDIVGNMDIIVDEDIVKERFIKKIYETNGKLVLIDDFSGTGQSIIKNLYFYLNESNIKQTDVYVVLLTYTEMAKKSILTKYPNCNFIGDEKCSSVQSVIPDMDIETLRNKIIKINSRLKISNEKKYLLGLDDTGSLVSLLRTPNNTVSTFWKSTKRGVENRAIFPRF